MQENKSDAQPSPQPNTGPAIIWESLRHPKAGWVLFVISTFLLSLLTIINLAGVNPLARYGSTIINPAQQNTNISNKPEEPAVMDDPIHIKGSWEYTTDLRSKEFPNGRNGIIRLRGENTVIEPDQYGYSMYGQRTHIQHLKHKDDEDFERIPNGPVDIKMDGVGFNENYFYFQFKIMDGSNTWGFVNLNINRTNKEKVSIMTGHVFYLHDNNKWSVATIIFKRIK